MLCDLSESQTPCLCLGCSCIHGYFGTQGHRSAEIGTLSHIPKGVASSSLAGASASLNSVFLVLVKIALGCTKCPWHSQNWKLLGWSELHLWQRAAHTQFALCSTVARRKRRFRLAVVKTPGLFMQTIHSVASKNTVSSGNSFEIRRSYSRAQSDCWQHLLFCDTWARKYIVWNWIPFGCEEVREYPERSQMWPPTPLMQ